MENAIIVAYTNSAKLDGRTKYRALLLLTNYSLE